MAEIKKTEQTMRYSDEELSLIKNTFCENDSLLKVLRKFFLQGELNDEEMKIMRAFAISSESVAVLRKTLLPEIDLDAPFFQMVDLYVNIDTKEHSVEKAYPLIKARDLMHDYLTQQFAALEDKSPAVVINFTDLHKAQNKTPQEAFIQLSSRNTILSHIEFQLQNLKMLAGLRDETIEATKARLQANAKKNSSK